MKKFPHGNAGPHDPELVELIIEALWDIHSRKPYCEATDLIADTNFLNLLVDNINDIFSEFLYHDRLFHQGTRTKH